MITLPALLFWYILYACVWFGAIGVAILCQAANVGDHIGWGELACILAIDLVFSALWPITLFGVLCGALLSLRD